MGRTFSQVSCGSRARWDLCFGPKKKPRSRYARVVSAIWQRSVPITLPRFFFFCSQSPLSENADVNERPQILGSTLNLNAQIVLEALVPWLSIWCGRPTPLQRVKVTVPLHLHTRKADRR